MRLSTIPVKWTEAEKVLVKENYLKPDGFDILKKFLPHRGYNSIKACGNTLGLTRKVFYTKNDEFFSIPNDINCWVAGFIAADGYVYLPKQRLHITLCEKDIAYLSILMLKTGYNGKIYIRSPKLREITLKLTGKSYTIGKNKIATLLVAKASQWIRDLDRNWNITTCKTFTLKPPPLTNLRHILCFLSGFIDGDGWVCLNNTKCKKYKKILEISAMGTKEMMTWYMQIFDYLTPGWNAKLQKDTSPNIYIFKTTGVRSYLLTKIFLSLDIPRLDRKWDNARQYIQDMDENGLRDKRFNTKLQKISFDWTLLDRLKTEVIRYHSPPIEV